MAVIPPEPVIGSRFGIVSIKPGARPWVAEGKESTQLSVKILLCVPV
jgi:hypothetical protein